MYGESSFRQCDTFLSNDGRLYKAIAGFHIHGFNIARDPGINGSKVGLASLARLLGTYGIPIDKCPFPD